MKMVDYSSQAIRCLYFQALQMAHPRAILPQHFPDSLHKNQKREREREIEKSESKDIQVLVVNIVRMLWRDALFISPSTLMKIMKYKLSSQKRDQSSTQNW